MIQKFILWQVELQKCAFVCIVYFSHMFVCMSNVLFSLVTSISLVCYTVLGFKFFNEYKSRNNTCTIKVLGLSDDVITSDRCCVVLRISEVGPSLTVSSRVDRSSASVIKFLTENEISQNDINVVDVRINDNAGYGNTVKDANFRYNACATIEFTSDEVEFVRNKLIPTIRKLFPSVNCTINYSCKDFKGISHKLIEQATIDARERAKIISDTSGDTLGKLISISTRKINILNADSYSNEWSDGEHSYKKRVRIIVDAVYEKK